MRYLILLFLFVLTSCGREEVNDKQVRLAFGSCGKANRKQPVLSLAAKTHPDAFIYLGDNIYGDTYSMDTLRLKYQQLADRPEFQELKATTQLFATWDDHDFGWNDAGRHYPFKEESKTFLLLRLRLRQSSSLSPF